MTASKPSPIKCSISSYSVSQLASSITKDVFQVEIRNCEHMPRFEKIQVKTEKTKENEIKKEQQQKKPITICLRLINGIITNRPELVKFEVKQKKNKE